jgi:hypothetical protein
MCLPLRNQSMKPALLRANSGLAAGADFSAPGMSDNSKPHGPALTSGKLATARPEGAKQTASSAGQGLQSAGQGAA